MAVEVFIYKEDTGLGVYEDLTALEHADADSIVWIDIEADDSILLEEIAARYSLHELTIEDCLTPGHFPKLDDYGTYIFMVVRGLKSQPELMEIWENDEVESERYTSKVAIYLSNNFIITFRRFEIPWLAAVSRQVKQYPDQIFDGGTTALAHRILDVLTDRFMRGLGYFERKIDDFELLAIRTPKKAVVTDILELKSELSYLRQIMRDQRAMIARLATESTLITDKQQRRYFKDIDDHSLISIRELDKLIDESSGAREAYFSMQNARLNDTMRVLAVITTIAAPLNILVGLYGMNFKLIPLLDDPNGFWIIVLMLSLLSVLMLVFCRKKGWI